MVLPDVNVLVTAYRDDVSDTDNTLESPRPTPAAAAERGDFGMNQSQLTELLDSLRNFPHEIEWVEFKEAKNGHDFNELGEYFSALSNEANHEAAKSVAG